MEILLTLIVLGAVWAIWGPKIVLVVIAMPFVMVLLGVAWIELTRPAPAPKQSVRGDCFRVTDGPWCAYR
jgi:hypothetical protein